MSDNIEDIVAGVQAKAESDRMKGVRDEKVNQRIFQRMDNSPYEYQSYVNKDANGGQHRGHVFAYHPKHGYVGEMSWDGRDGEVMMLKVHPEHENLGVGMGMYAHAITMAARTNMRQPTHSDMMTGASVGVTKKLHPENTLKNVDVIGKRLPWFSSDAESLNYYGNGLAAGNCQNCGGGGKVVKNYFNPSMVECPTCEGSGRKVEQ